MTACPLCTGFAGRHDPIARDAEPVACVICGYPPADHEGDGQMLHDFVQLDDQCPITNRRCDRPCRGECIRGMAPGPDCGGDGGWEQ